LCLKQYNWNDLLIQLQIVPGEISQAYLMIGSTLFSCQIKVHIFHQTVMTKEWSQEGNPWHAIYCEIWSQTFLHIMMSEQCSISYQKKLFDNNNHWNAMHIIGLLKINLVLKIPFFVICMHTNWQSLTFWNHKLSTGTAYHTTQLGLTWWETWNPTSMGMNWARKSN
jgi:hypothetical protein